MSEKTDKLHAAYVQLSESEGGKHLLSWIEKTADDKRKNASKSQDTAFGELKFADGLEEVATHIKQMLTLR